MKLRLLACSLAVALACAGGAFAQQGIRPEVGKPLQAAGDLLRAGKAKEALAKAREADAVGGKSAAEQLLVDRMKAAAAQRAGDNATAIAALESIHGRVGAGEQGAIAEQIASAYAQQRNNAKATEWVNKATAAGYSSPTLKQLQGYLQGASGDYAAIGREAAANITAAEQAGRKPDEADLLRLADAQMRTNNPGGQVATLEKLVAYYPKREYWSALLSRMQRKPGFADRFGLDVMRLKLATGLLEKPEDYMEMAQLSLQAGLAAEGRRVVEKGFSAGVLGTGPEAARHGRLRDLAVKQEGESKALLAGKATEAAQVKEGDALVQVGFAYAMAGDFDNGIKLIDQGIAKGSLRRPEDAKLRLGMALQQSGKAKTRANQVLRSVQGNDGASDIARAWLAQGN